MGDYSSVVWTSGDTITETKLDNMVSNDTAEDAHPSLKLTEIVAPATPAANKLHLYAKDDSSASALYLKGDDGIEHKLGGAIALPFMIGSGAAVPSTGIQGMMQVPFDCYIDRVDIFGDASGSGVVDIWKDTYANFPPTDADSITASAPPTLSSAVKNSDSTLTGWTRTINAGDILYFNLDSVATCKWIVVVIWVRRV